MATAAAPSVTQLPRTTQDAPWYLYCVVAASLSVICGLIWDISWHRTIGRDTFWTPAHMAIYLGGILAGGSSGWLVLKTTFAGSPDERAGAVSFWGFRGPLGAWVCIWGSFAMVTSAPFDNWWHDAYGLDVTILSPPHAVLGMGIAGIQIGALLMTLAAQNRVFAGPVRSPLTTHRPLQWLFVIAAAVLITMHAVMTMEYNFTNQMHGSEFYRIAAVVFPLILVAAARGSTLKFPATTITAIYMILMLAMIWLLQLFPAEPRLAPITHPVDHLVPPHFPLLLIVPALGVDLLMKRSKPDRDWRLSLLVGATFILLLLAVQWFFADFLLSPLARNYVFAAGKWGYNEGPGDWYYRFWGTPESPAAFARGMGTAVLIAAFGSRLGLWMGRWMARVQR